MTPIVGLLADNKRRWRVRQLVLHIGLIFKIFPLDDDGDRKDNAQ